MNYEEKKQFHTDESGYQILVFIGKEQFFFNAVLQCKNRPFGNVVPNERRIIVFLHTFKFIAVIPAVFG